MVASYARRRLLEQVRSVAFVIIYLVVFQTVILGVPPANATSIAGGIGMVVFGLAFFLEGLLLGIMPLGERVGVQLPGRGGILVIVLCGVLVGAGATFAEPAIAALRIAGENVKAWEAPLLYMLLERSPESLISAIGMGVGGAVALGMVRFYYGLSIKPFVLTIVPVLLILSVAWAMDSGLAAIVGLAWDSGAVTTGPVTVPLVLALGIGVSRAAGKSEGPSGGFGVIMLASALPILAVLVLGAIVRPAAPEPTTEERFFSSEHREEALLLFDSEKDLLRHAFRRGSEAGRRAYFDDEAAYLEAVESLGEDPGARRALLGEMPLSRWVAQRASDGERERMPRVLRAEEPDETLAAPPAPVPRVLAEESALAVQAIVPLTALLALVLVFYLRDRPRYVDEVVLGIALALVGMTLLTAGLRLGLEPLGDEVGRQLPRVFRGTEEDAERIVIEDFDEELVFESIGADGERRRHFYLRHEGQVEPVRFDPERFREHERVYEHVVRRPALFGPDLTALGVVLVFVFAFGLGYGSTLAEPALNAHGRTVEEVTVGTIKRKSVVRAVSIGVGIGIVVGVARILYDISTVWLLIPPYVALIPVTLLSDEDFAGIAWDSGGVTTGPVTVPLVLAMGLGIGGEVDVVHGFGVLAMASVYPILSVSIFGLIVRARQRRTMREAEREDDDG